MINYNEMEKVITDLNTYVDDLQKISATQKKMEITIHEITKIKNIINDCRENISDYTSVIEKIESTHNDIKQQTQQILNDYKNLHSAFDLVETKFKSLENSLQEENNKILVSQKKISNIETKIIENIKEQKHQNKKTKIRFWILAAISVGILIASIIGLFI